MSDKERSLAEQLAELPAAVQDKFLLMAQGAAVAVECAREEKETPAAAEDEGIPHQSPAATASPRGSRDGGAA